MTSNANQPPFSIHKSAVIIFIILSLLLILPYAVSVYYAIELPYWLAYLYAFILVLITAPTLMLNLPVQAIYLLPYPNSTLGWSLGLLLFSFCLYSLCLALAFASRSFLFNMRK